MNYATIKRNDIANGTGVRVSLFVSGCTHKCKGCFNEVAWDFNYGEKFTLETEELIISYLKPDFVEGLTLLGGEPMEPSNQRALLPFVKKVKEIYPDKTIWCYTGYTLEKDLLGESRVNIECTGKLLSYIDVLVDGEFVQDLYDISLQFRGSSNQRIIDLKPTLSSGELVLWND